MTGFFAMDVEDYYFPEQAEARRADMEGAFVRVEGSMFADPRAKEEVQRLMLADMEKHPEFILCSVKAEWDDDILKRISLAFFVDTPLAVRLERIRVRDLRRFGGGQDDFMRMVAGRGEMTASEAGKRLKCPVIELDGRLPAQENVARIIEYMNTGA